MIYLIRITPDTDSSLIAGGYYSSQEKELFNNGEVYRVQVLDKQGDNVHSESIWGYLGIDYAKEQADLKARELEEQSHEVGRLYEWAN